jgi:hypothetical protein
MTERILFISHKIPEYSADRQEARQYLMVQALCARYEVHFMCLQTLFVKKEAEERLRSWGVTIINFQELRQNRSVSLQKQMEDLFISRQYRMIVFSTYFPAKYYLPYLHAVRYDGITVIDAGRSQYLSEMAFARAHKDPVKRVTMLKEARIDKMKEIPVYSNADLVIVDGPVSRQELTGDIPLVPIAVVSGNERTSCNDEAVAAETAAVFSSAVKRPAFTANTDQVQWIAVKNSTAAASCEDCSFSFPRVPESRAAVTEASITALNAAIAGTDKKHVLIAPRDTIIPEQALHRMLFCAGSNPSYGVILPLTNAKIDAIARPEGLSDFLPKHYLANFGVWHEAARVFDPCLLARRDLFDTVGFFDPRFTTLSWACTDLCLRALQAGLLTITTNEAFLFHRQLPREQERDAVKDRDLLLQKWGAAGTAFLEELRHE